MVDLLWRCCFGALLLLASLSCRAQEEPIVSIVTTEAGIERGATARELPAYELYNAAVAAAGRGEPVRAVASLRLALEIKADMPEAWINLGNLLADAAATGDGEMGEAVEAYERAMLCCDHPRILAQAQSNLGYTIHRASRGDVTALDAAARHLDEATRLAPDFVDARFNYATVLQDLGRVDDARREYEATLALAPTHENARLNLANLYFAEGDSSAAFAIQLALVRDATLSKSTRLNAMNNLGQTYRDAGDHVSAERYFEQAVHLDRSDANSLANLATARRTTCDWEGFEELQLELLQQVRVQLAASTRGAVPSRRQGLLGLMPYDAQLQASVPSQVARDLAAAHLRQRFGASAKDLESKGGRPFDQGDRGRALRVGYLSFDFREHPMGYLTRRLLSDHDPSRVRAVALSYGADDGSVTRLRAERLVSGGFVELADCDVATCKRLIEQQRLEVVVDLMAHTRGARLELAALVPRAAILISYLGYPGTAGGAHYDYTMADRRVAPVEAARDSFAEKLLLLPNSYQANDYALAWPAPPVERKRSSSRGPRLCNLNQMDKFEPVSWTLWMNVLRRLPLATLSLLAPKPPLGPTVVAALAAEAAARGVAVSRLVWLERLSKQEHLERLADQCDLFVDHLVYGAHTTAADALWAYVPLVAPRGFGGGDADLFGRFASRVGASLLLAAGLTETLVDSLRDFETVAHRLGCDGRLLAQVRRRTLAASVRSPLFDAQKSARNMETAYAAAYEVAKCGAGRRHVVVDPAQTLHHRETLQACALKSALAALTGGGAVCLDEPDAEEAALAGAQPLQDQKRQLGTTLRLRAAYPDDADARHLYGLALHLAGRHVEAAAELTRAVSLQPGIAHFWTNLGHVRRSAGDFLGASAAFLASLSLADEVVQRSALSEALAHSVGSEQDPSKVVQQLFTASQLAPNDASLRLRLGAALDGAGDGAGALDEWRTAVVDRHAHLAAGQLCDDMNCDAVLANTTRKKASDARRDRANKASEHLSVAIYCDEYGQTWWPSWGPSSHLSTGLGGSEEAVVFVARELAKRGHHVEVYAEPLASDVGADAWGVRWLRHSDYDATAPPDVFVAWRYHVSAALALPRSAFGTEASEDSYAATVPHRTYVWLQDVPGFGSWTPRFVDALSGIFTLSTFHTRTLPAHARSKAFVTPNGIDPGFLKEGYNLAHVFVYGSAPNRGLQDVLQVWPQVRLQLGQHCTLVVYYGFSKAFVTWGRANVPDFDAWQAGMERLLEQEGVEYRGMVSHGELAAGYANASFALYPTTYPETGCVSLMKAMAMGCIPITSRYKDSVLPELTAHFDLGALQIQIQIQIQKKKRLNYHSSKLGRVWEASLSKKHRILKLSLSLSLPFRTNHRARRPRRANSARSFLQKEKKPEQKALKARSLSLSLSSKGPPTQEPRTADVGASIRLHDDDDDELGAPHDEARARDREWLRRYTESIIDAARRAANGELDEHRRAMIRYARDRFLWKHVAEKWEQHFQGLHDAPISPQVASILTPPPTAESGPLPR